MRKVDKEEKRGKRGSLFPKYEPSTSKFLVLEPNENGIFLTLEGHQNKTKAHKALIFCCAL